MHGCRFFLIIVRLGHGYCRLLRQQSGGQVVRQRGKVARGCKKGGGGTDKKRNIRGGCRLLGCMCTVVRKGFAWVCVRVLLHLTSCMIIFARLCVRMVTLFEVVGWWGVGGVVVGARFRAGQIGSRRAQIPKWVTGPTTPPPTTPPPHHPTHHPTTPPPTTQD